jgi:hypothetical protein
LGLRENEVEQEAQALAADRASFEEEQASTQAAQAEASTRAAYVNQLATSYQAMAPANAVQNLLALQDDQLVIAILRATETQAAASGTTSMVSVWLSQMNTENAARTAEITRKMAAGQ